MALTDVAAVLPELELPLSERSGKYLPSTIRSQLAGLPAGAQYEFLEEFERRSKSLGAAYFYSLFYCHHAFLGRCGTTAAMWLASLATLGMAGMIWWLIDLFRLPSLVRSYNQTLAFDILRSLRAVHN